VRWLSTGVLARSESVHWPVLVPVGRWLLLLVCGALAIGLGSRRLRWSPAEAVLGVLLAFLSLYGALSAQYLLWVVPFGLLCAPRRSLVYAVAASVGLVGFYDLLAPGVLTPADQPLFPAAVAGALWVVGVAAVLVCCWSWLGRLVHDGWSRDPADRVA
jgi:hypothetical protein